MTERKQQPEQRVKKLKDSIGIIKEKIKKVAPKTDDKSKDLMRSLRKLLKRTQRKLTSVVPVTPEDKQKRAEKLSEMVNKGLDVLKKQGKKPGDPYMHSLNKKLKSLNKRLRKFKRQQEKQKQLEERKAKAAAAKQAPSEVKTEAQPEAPKS